MSRGIRVALAGAGSVAAAAAVRQWVPSVVSLGQWLPVRSLPGGWCTWRGPERPDRPAVALTFDDGPDPDSTPLFLDRLAELGLRATFLCSGVQVARHPDLVGTIVAGGHVVGTHGHTHEHHLGRTGRWVTADLGRAVGALADAGVTPRWYRPPYGQASGPSLAAAHRAGLRTVLWSAWGREWAAPDARAVADRVIGGLVPGAVVLLHDSDAFSPAGSARRALDALGSIADEMHRRGLEARTLDALVAP